MRCCHQPINERCSAAGDAVDEAVVCGAATYEEGEFVDLDGKVLTNEERDQLMQVGVETGEIVFSAKYGR